MKHKASLIFAAALAFCFFTGCKTFDQPKNVEKPLDYTDRDVVENEINTIHELLKTDCTKALFRACLLGEKELLDVDLSVNIPLEQALDLGWKILADCFDKSEVGIPTKLSDKFWPRSSAA